MRVTKTLEYDRNLPGCNVIDWRPVQATHAQLYLIVCRCFDNANSVNN